MTIAAAVIDRDLGFVVIGVDTEWWNGSVRTTGPSKLQRHGEWVCASSGAGWSQEMLIEWSAARHHGSADNGHWSAPWHVIVAGPTGLWELTGDGTVIEPVLGYLAIGSGGAVAHGAMHATRHLTPDVRVQLALEAACDHADGCARPFHIESIALQETPYEQP